MKKLFLLALLLGLSSFLTADDLKRYEFAQSLFNEGDYYRAIGIYKEYAFYQPQGAKVEDAFLQIGFSYYKAQKWDEAANAFERVEERQASPYKRQALLAESMAYQLKKDYAFSQSLLGKLRDQDLDVNWKERADYSDLWNEIYLNHFEEASKLANNLNQNQTLKDSAANLKPLLAQHQTRLARRPVWLGGVFSALLPGLGQIYAGKIMDGLVATGINGLLIYNTYVAFQRNDLGGQLLYGIPETVFYASNIYSGAAAVEHYNNNQRDAYLKSLESFKVDLLTLPY